MTCLGHFLYEEVGEMQKYGKKLVRGRRRSSVLEYLALPSFTTLSLHLPFKEADACAGRYLGR